MNICNEFTKKLSMFFTHLQLCKLQGKAYGWNDEKLKQDL